MNSLGGYASDFSFMRLLRTLRLFRALRVLRLLTFFEELYIAIHAICKSMKSLVGTCFLLALLMFIMGTVFAQIAHIYYLDHRILYESIEDSSARVLDDTTPAHIDMMRNVQV